MTTNRKQENEVYILGSDSQEAKIEKGFSKKWLIAIVLLVGALIGIIAYTLLNKEQTPEYYFEPEQVAEKTVSITPNRGDISASGGYIEAVEDTINDVVLKIFIPHKAAMSLTVGLPNIADSSIIFATMAADIRKDNQQIVGDFILAGERISRGVAKKGFCAIIDETISLGVGDETPLIQQAFDKGGSFFRQYPLVHQATLIENKPKNKSIRRALAVRNEQIVMVESRYNESFHDFSQALIDCGISDAIYLVGGNAYGWYYNKDHELNEYGDKLTEIPENISYIVWKAK